MKNLHPKNLHNENYDFSILCLALPELKQYVQPNKYGNLSIDFSQQISVITLNRAILKTYYGINYWTIPTGHLCPPIPGRSDYIHYLSELLDLEKTNRGLDIGTGVGCIYPLLGHSLYKFHFTATDIDKNSLNLCQKIIDNNKDLNLPITLKFQPNKGDIFKNIIEKTDLFDFSMCNPPFHKSFEEANQGSLRKVRNLNKSKQKKGHQIIEANTPLNFGGKKNELWCNGGELKFILKMIFESTLFKNQVLIFSTLVSKKEHLIRLEKELINVKVKSKKIIKMNQGNKVTHLLIWSFSKKL